MNISIVTAVKNGMPLLQNCCESVARQSADIEHIIVVAPSSDGTEQFLVEYCARHKRLVVDEGNGIYPALNQGIVASSTGIIGVLHSDDVFYDDNICKLVCRAFDADESLELVFGDALIVDRTTGRPKRYYASKDLSVENLSKGFMPAHTACFFRRSVFARLGHYLESYKIAADYELLIRCALANVKYRNLNAPLVRMRDGGISSKSLMARFELNREVYRACKLHGLTIRMQDLVWKYFSKIREFDQ